VSGRVTRIGLSIEYTPGVRIRFLPDASAALIVRTESDGLAMKKRSIGIASPSRLPVDQWVPDVPLFADGTNTAYFPPSTNRYGASRDTGVVGSEVLPPGAKSVAGAPSTPEKT
jgi:hypothetical protein